MLAEWVILLLMGKRVGEKRRQPRGRKREDLISISKEKPEFLDTPVRP